MCSTSFDGKLRQFWLGTFHQAQPNAFPEIRLRFTPAAGLIYGPDQIQRMRRRRKTIPALIRSPTDRQIYDASEDTRWYQIGQGIAKNQTVPPSLFAIEPPAPSWLYDNVAISRGYFDDACDGFVEVQSDAADGSKLAATARICAAPPAMAPDSLFVRTLVDDLEQVIHGPEVAAGRAAEVTRASALDIVRRAYETVRFMNVAVMNGNDFKGRPALSLDSMPEEEAADTQRADPAGHGAGHGRYARDHDACTSRSTPPCAAAPRPGSCGCCAGPTRSLTSPTAAGARCRR